MEPIIPNDSWCIFKKDPGGSREGKVVLVQCNLIHDAETSGRFTVKRYHSEKELFENGTWRHKKITLSPQNNAYIDENLGNPMLLLSVGVVLNDAMCIEGSLLGASLPWSLHTDCWPSLRQLVNGESTQGLVTAMKLLGFELDNSDLEIDGEFYDLHNNFIFRGFSYVVATRELVACNS